LERLPELERLSEQLVVGIKAEEWRRWLTETIVRAGLVPAGASLVSLEWNRAYGGYYVFFTPASGKNASPE